MTNFILINMSKMSTFPAKKTFIFFIRSTFINSFCSVVMKLNVIPFDWGFPGIARDSGWSSGKLMGKSYENFSAWEKNLWRISWYKSLLRYALHGSNSSVSVSFLSFIHLRTISLYMKFQRKFFCIKDEISTYTCWLTNCLSCSFINGMSSSSSGNLNFSFNKSCSKSLRKNGIPLDCYFKKKLFFSHLFQLLDWNWN